LVDGLLEGEADQRDKVWLAEQTLAVLRQKLKKKKKDVSTKALKK
jgi:hypothetical protein